MGWRNRHRHSRVSNAVRQLDGWPGHRDAEPSAGQHFLIHAGVKVREAFGELDLVTVDHD